MRPLWTLVEGIHASPLCSPEGAQVGARSGLGADPWARLLAWRSAPLGELPASEVAQAFPFHAPELIMNDLPRLRGRVNALQAQQDWFEAAERTLSRAWAGCEGGALVAATDRLEGAVRELTDSGGLVVTAYAAVPSPASVHLRLWWAATVLREHRGECHLQALAAHGLDPVEAMINFVAVGGAPTGSFADRGWRQERWQEATHSLCSRGLLADDGTGTAVGAELRRAVEAATDAAWGLGRLSHEEAVHLSCLLRPLAACCTTSAGAVVDRTLGLNWAPGLPVQE